MSGFVGVFKKGVRILSDQVRNATGLAVYFGKVQYLNFLGDQEFVLDASLGSNLEKQIYSTYYHNGLKVLPDVGSFRVETIFLEGTFNHYNDWLNGKRNYSKVIMAAITIEMWLQQILNGKLNEGIDG